MSDGFVLFLFLLSLILYVVFFCIVRFYLFKYFVNKSIVNDYLGFNLKSYKHTKYLYRIVFKNFDNCDFYAKRIRFFYFIQIVYLFFHFS